MLSQRSWEHERTLEPAAEGACVLTDRVRCSRASGYRRTAAAPHRMVLPPPAQATAPPLRRSAAASGQDL